MPSYTVTFERITTERATLIIDDASSVLNAAEQALASTGDLDWQREDSADPVIVAIDSQSTRRF